MSSFNDKTINSEGLGNTISHLTIGKRHPRMLKVMNKSNMVSWDSWRYLICELWSCGCTKSPFNIFLLRIYSGYKEGWLNVQWRMKIDSCVIFPIWAHLMKGNIWNTRTKAYGIQIKREIRRESDIFKEVKMSNSSFRGSRWVQSTCDNLDHSDWEGVSCWRWNTYEVKLDLIDYYTIEII